MCRVIIAQGQPPRDVHSATATMREAAHDLTVAAALSKLARPRCSEPPSWCLLLPVQWGGRGGAWCRVSIAQGQPLRDRRGLQRGVNRCFPFVFTSQDLDLPHQTHP